MKAIVTLVFTSEEAADAWSGWYQDGGGDECWYDAAPTPNASDFVPEVMPVVVLDVEGK